MRPRPISIRSAAPRSSTSSTARARPISERSLKRPGARVPASSFWMRSTPLRRAARPRWARWRSGWWRNCCHRRRHQDQAGGHRAALHPDSPGDLLGGQGQGDGDGLVGQQSGLLQPGSQGTTGGLAVPHRRAAGHTRVRRADRGGQSDPRPAMLVVSAKQMVVYVLKGHDFTGCGKTQSKPCFERARLQSCRKRP
jgi:hypothetical protein